MNEPDPRRAIVDRREEIAAEPRPAPLSHVDVSERLVDMQGADIYRLYRPEWLVVYTVMAGSDDSLDEYFQHRYAGRVLPEDVRYVFFDGTGVNRLMLRLPNLKGEFKYAHLAQRHAEEQGYDEYQIVTRNSKDDHALRSYGVTKLPKDAARSEERDEE